MQVNRFFSRDLESWRPQIAGFGLEVLVAAIVCVVLGLILLGSPSPSHGYEYEYGYGSNAASYNDGQSHDGYTHRDGLWWKGGNSYQRTAKTCWKDNRYWVDACCGGGYWATKRVAYTCYDYLPYAYATPESGIEKFATQLLAIKKAEVQSELKVREGYAESQRDRDFAQTAKELAQSFGVTDYRIQGFGQYLGYGDEYQFPAQQGSTVYGVREYAGDFYGEAAIKLLDADRAIASAYELRKLSREYDHEAEISLNESVVAMDESRTHSVTALAEMRELRQSVSDGLRDLAVVAQAMKPEPRATIRGSERVWQPQKNHDAGQQSNDGDDVQHEPQASDDDGAAIDYGPLPKWADVVEQKCSECHDKHVARKSEVFPKGFNLENVGKWSARQKIRLWEVIDKDCKGVCMPPDEIESLTPAEEKSLKNWIASL